MHNVERERDGERKRERKRDRKSEQEREKEREHRVPAARLHDLRFFPLSVVLSPGVPSLVKRR